MSTSSVFTQKYRYKSKKPLGMDEKDYNEWHKWRACLITEGHMQTGCDGRMPSSVAALGVLPSLSDFIELKPGFRVWWGYSWFHTLQSRFCFQAANYALLWSIPSSSFSSHFSLEPEVTHRSFFPGELWLLCLLHIQLKSCLFWQNANIKVFYWKW